MKAAAWNPAEFDYDYQRRVASARLAIWGQLNSSRRKLYEEWDMFRRFGRSQNGPSIDLDSVTMLDPDSCQPPAPDLACRIMGGIEYFELAEVIEEDIARIAAQARKERATCYGGSVSLWPVLDAILSKTFSKLYCQRATPLSLLVYYGVGRQASFWEYLKPVIERELTSIQQRLSQSPFRALWLYDAHAKATLLNVTSAGATFI